MGADAKNIRYKRSTAACATVVMTEMMMMTVVSEWRKGGGNGYVVKRLDGFDD